MKYKFGGISIEFTECLPNEFRNLTILYYYN